jgi:hypothetical protein
MRHPKDSKQERVNMRYRNDNNDKNKRRYRKRETLAKEKAPNYFSAFATVVTTPRHECTVFRGSQIRPEVTVQAVLHYQDVSSRYQLRFTSKSAVEKAGKLRTGEKIHIAKAVYDYRPKRAETEVRVIDFLNPRLEGSHHLAVLEN